jgi:hypothetical protein
MCLFYKEYEISNVMIYYNFHTTTRPKYEIAKISLCQFQGKYEDIFFARIVSFDVHMQKIWF